ncbi:hypothetical protein MAR_021225 [Mya arenaria]|uniref:Ig-like domain-containing protein n=1 Tax=Mya arenaria TaxID=6604 RepID=A0ABY7EAB0_MYAAR|nr:hypothetical protein MAR_021225 [Mya arenaria]
MDKTHKWRIGTSYGRYVSISKSIGQLENVNPNGPPNISANEELLEGETVDITCTSSSARPPPLLKFLVEATEIDTNTNVSTIYEDSTGLYTSVSKLHSFKREWGNKNPPSRLIIAVIDQGNLSTTAVRCSALDSNPVCNIKWESSIEVFRYTILPQSNISTIWLNVTDVDYGKQINCSAECPHFLNVLSNSTILIFAKKPKVEIRLSSVLPVPPNTNLALTCFANAYPNGNITWTTLKAPNAPTSDGEFCVNASTCIYEMTTSDVEQEYNCIAKNAHGSDNSGFLDIAIGISSGIAFLLIITVVMCLCRYHIQAKNRKEDNQTEMAQLQSPTVAESDGT